MLKIGEFVKLTGISINMLRNYDSSGLLKPKVIDEITGYRYYSEDQIVIAARIKVLKDLGFSLSEIGKINILDDTEKIKQMINTNIKAREAELVHIQNQIKSLSKSLIEIDSSSKYIFSANIRHLDRMVVASYRNIINDFPEEGNLWAHLHEELGKRQIKYAVVPNTFATTYGVDFANKKFDVEVSVIIQNKINSFADIKIKEIDEQLIYALPFTGEYSKIGEIRKFMNKQIKENEYKVAGKSFIFYYVSPGNLINQDEYVSEFCIPLKKL